MSSSSILNGEHHYSTRSSLDGQQRQAHKTQANRILSDGSWSSIPSDILRAELARRQAENGASEKPACGSGDRGSYDTPLHVFALILILGLSTLGMPRTSTPQAKAPRS